MLNNLILATVMPDWLSTIYPIVKTVIVVLMLLCSIAIIFIVLSMDSAGEGAAANSITGARGIQDSFYKKNMSSSREGRSKKIMIFCSVLIAVLTVVYFVFSSIIASFA